MQTEWPRVEHDLDKKHGEEIRHACIRAELSSVQDGRSGLHKLNIFLRPTGLMNMFNIYYCTSLQKGSLGD